MCQETICGDGDLDPLATELVFERIRARALMNLPECLGIFAPGTHPEEALLAFTAGEVCIEVASLELFQRVAESLEFGLSESKAPQTQLVLQCTRFWSNPNEFLLEAHCLLRGTHLSEYGLEAIAWQHIRDVPPANLVLDIAAVVNLQSCENTDLVWQFCVQAGYQIVLPPIHVLDLQSCGNHVASAVHTNICALGVCPTNVDRKAETRRRYGTCLNQGQLQLGIDARQHFAIHRFEVYALQGCAIIAEEQGNIRLKMIFPSPALWRQTVKADAPFTIGSGIRADVGLLLHPPLPSRLDLPFPFILCCTYQPSSLLLLCLQDAVPVPSIRASRGQCFMPGHRQLFRRRLPPPALLGRISPARRLFEAAGALPGHGACYSHRGCHPVHLEVGSVGQPPTDEQRPGWSRRCTSRRQPCPSPARRRWLPHCQQQRCWRPKAL
mmetsp:Transcript_37473/g.98837  ORF Transcript_37473/g.98837 Transcript_37473/m.98837 type:complete len:439 (+) Transcript_37473:576-1892(+)